MIVNIYLLTAQLCYLLCLGVQTVLNQNGRISVDRQASSFFTHLARQMTNSLALQRRSVDKDTLKTMTAVRDPRGSVQNARSIVKGDVPSVFLVVVVIGYKMTYFTRERQAEFLSAVSKHINRKETSCHIWKIKKNMLGQISVNFYCIYLVSKKGKNTKKSFSAVMFVPSNEIVQAFSSGPMRGFLQKYNVTKYFIEGDPRGVTIAYAVTSEVWFPVAVVAVASCLFVFLIVCIVFCCRRTVCFAVDSGHTDRNEQLKHERLVFSPVKPMETMSPRMIQPDIGTLYTISGSPPKAQKWTASGEIKRGLFQSRRGSQASLVIDLSPVTKSPVIDMGHESPTEETLSKKSRVLDYHDLRTLKDDEKALYGEFWSIPSNTATRKEKEFQSSLKNRYPDIIPNTRSLVTLEQIGDDPLSTYINANFITGYSDTKDMYIATEGPLQSTVNNFWRMIWQYRCPIIVMITKLKEKNEEKCSEYLPSPKSKRQQTFGDIVVTYDSEISRPGYKITTLYITHKDLDVSRPVLHYWFTSWPDHKVPKSCTELLSMAREVQAARKSLISPGPMVIHCSAGRGRTGCFIALSHGMKQIENNGLIDILSIVSNMRIERGGMVQRDSQYSFIHKALFEYWSELRSSSPYLQPSGSIEEGEEAKESDEENKGQYFAW